MPDRHLRYRPIAALLVLVTMWGLALPLVHAACAAVRTARTEAAAEVPRRVCHAPDTPAPDAPAHDVPDPGIPAPHSCCRMRPAATYLPALPAPPPAPLPAVMLRTVSAFAAATVLPAPRTVMGGDRRTPGVARYLFLGVFRI